MYLYSMINNIGSNNLHLLRVLLFIKNICSLLFFFSLFLNDNLQFIVPVNMYDSCPYCVKRPSLSNKKMDLKSNGRQHLFIINVKGYTSGL